MSDSVGKFKDKAKELMAPIEALMKEAKAEGYSLEVYSSTGIDGQPSTRIAVTLR